ncbi:hypothetical protein PanWU01x14_275290 [Parasponia andersonii]|uniref:DUF7138 domain-containing protein n=1 Tax=Parasponia andersonii TaxID=3476 RepID=A0A2P5B3I7_PARAD|nr:hypothetical protein PanWU01x14_275290 [Parasponia andersonii]
MVEIAGGGVSFPIVFFDGESETDIGSFAVSPTLDFKRFQSVLSRKIGISPHQFSVYLSSPETRKRIPITGKFNFGAISSEKGCFFVVVLKRSKRERRRRSLTHQNLPEDLYYSSSPATAANPHRSIKKAPPENVTLLRRDMVIAHNDQSLYGFLSPFSDRVGYAPQGRNYQLEKQRYEYLMNMDLSGLGRDSTKPIKAVDDEKSVRGGGGLAVCEDCLRAEESGTEVGFHWCVYDPVTFGFRSAVGPIARPFKGPDDFGSLGFSET